MSRRVRLLPLCLALLALAWAQVFGLMRGYICDCGGEVSITAAEHCHGPHGAACHERSPEADNHERAPVNGTTQHHDVLKETVVANQKLQVLAAPLPSLILIAELPNWTLPVLALNNLFTERSADLRAGAGEKRHWPRVLTHTIALRV